ncbi:MAG: leucine--tRNA ligase [Bacteroidota bacterium]
MGSYNFQQIEKKWQKYWKDNRSFVAEKKSDLPKYYVLDMFPYPSGAGLHVGHPLGYIATDIIARYKRQKGFNVLHPMGFDAFGLPAEQYAIKTGIHPAETTDKNTVRYLEQMEMLGFYHDPDTAFRTSDPDYYKWTQWVFMKMFNHWYDKKIEKARLITELEAHFEVEGSQGIVAATAYSGSFTAEEWKGYSPKEKGDILMAFRIAYTDQITVNWCPGLGTVLADAEVKDGRSERGNFPVERKLMKQWMLRITAYSDRLLADLEKLEWSDAVKSMQRNWIGRSEGASIVYDVDGVDDQLEVFTTRPDTIYGNTFMVVAPEHPIIEKICTAEQKEEVDKYIDWAVNRSERDRIADTKKTGVWTGGYAIHPLNGTKLPIWISDYVVITYGTGAIMAVPAHDQRDFEFAHKFDISIIEVISGGDLSKEAYISKDGIMVNSDFVNGKTAREAIPLVVKKFEEIKRGTGRVTYKQRDVVWSRQRYWGEPTPIYYKDEVAYSIDESELPLVLPDVESYKPSETGEPPLSRAGDWVNYPGGGTRDLNTMPGWAGSSWYFFRYPDPFNEKELVDPSIEKYWLPVDLYVGGTEHAVLHLMYARFWTKFMYDIDVVSVEEPFTKLVNQGKIQGVSKLAFRDNESGEFVSADLISEGERDKYAEIHVDISLVQDHSLDTEGYMKWTREEGLVFKTNADGEFKTISRAEKMSKSLYNTVAPDVICEQYGADTLRMFEMFLGPIEMEKPWSTESINGVFTFLRKIHNLYFDQDENSLVTEGEPTAEELKFLHQTIKKTEEGIDRLAFNVCIPAFMVFEKELKRLKCRKRAILEPFAIIMSPFAPHLCEEIWESMGHKESILKATFPKWEAELIKEQQIQYPVQINGKVRFKLSVDADMSKELVEEKALSDPNAQKWLEGKSPRKVIVVPGRIVNIVL